MNKHQKKDNTQNLSDGTDGGDRGGGDGASLLGVQGRDIWAKATGALAGTIPAEDYERWILPLRFIIDNDGTVLIGAKSRFSHSRISTAHRERILAAWLAADPQEREAELVCWATLPEDIRSLVTDPWESPASGPAASAAPLAADDVNVMSPAIMRFDTLVVGPSNSTAFATAERIAGAGSLAGSVFVISGPQGVGKTHLMKSIEGALLAEGRRSVAYISAEEFYVSYVDGARNRDTRALKARVRGAEVVLFDDLQIVVGMKETNKELAGTLRTVSERGGVVVLTSSTPICELAGLSEAVQTVLKGATCIAIDYPDDDMRRQIVRRRADMLQRQSPAFVLSDELCDEMVERVDGPGRDLCGTLLSLHAETTFGEVAPTRQMLDKVICRKQGQQKPVTLDAIKRAVCKVMGVTRADLEGQRRFKRIAQARKSGMYLSRTMTGKSYPQIAAAYGGKHHTTVISAYDSVVDLLPQDPGWQDEIEQVTRLAVRISSGRAL